ncbi:MAG: hypothetical protein ABIY51_04180 [Ferruginibacter sp.]
MIKGFLITVIGLFIMITIISLFIPSKINTVKSVVIHAKENKISNEISDLLNWRNWQPVFKEEVDKIKISNPSSGKNAFAEWISNAKTSQVKIIESNKNYTKFLLKQQGQKDIENIISISPVDDSTAWQVQWQSITYLKWYPWEKFAGIFIEKMTGPGYEASLNGLKNYLENNINQAN